MSTSRLEATTFITPATCFTVACIAFSLVALSTVWRNSRNGSEKPQADSHPREGEARPKQQRRKAVDDLFAETRERPYTTAKQDVTALDESSRIGELVSLCASVARLLRRNHDGQTRSTEVDLISDLSMLTASLCRAQRRTIEGPIFPDSGHGHSRRLQAVVAGLQATLVLLEASVEGGSHSTSAITSCARSLGEQTAMLDSFLDTADIAHQPPTPPPEIVVEACLDDANPDRANMMSTAMFDPHTGITPATDDRCWIEPPPEYSPPAGCSSNVHPEKLDSKVEVQAPITNAPLQEDKPLDSSALYDAVNDNDSDTLDDLLTRGADPATRFGELERTALHQAADQNSCSCIATLLKHGAVMSSEDAKGDTALHLAAWAGNVEALAALLTHGAEVDWLSGRDGYSPLWCAVSARQIDAARLLLKNGARVSLRSASGGGLTPLHQAAVTGQSAMVELLLDRGAQAGCLDEDKNTPLHYAAASGSVPSLKILLRNDADIEAVQIHGLTAVHWAAHKGHVGALRVLLDHGARLDRRAEEGATPLHLAANRGHLDAARLLLERGARKDVSRAAWDGVSGTPAAMAKAKGHKQLARILEV